MMFVFYLQITGAGNGIGKAMALRFAAEKCKIAVVDIEENAAKQTAHEIVQKGGSAVAYCVSVDPPPFPLLQ